MTLNYGLQVTIRGSKNMQRDFVEQQSVTLSGVEGRLNKK